MRGFLTPVAPRAVLARAAGLALAAGGLMALRLLERGEAFSPRTALLLGFLALAGAGTGLVAYTFTGLLGRLPRPVRFLLGALLTGVGVAGLFYLLFALHLRGGDLDTSGEHGHDSLFHVVVGTMIDALGFYVVTGRAYLVPWTLPGIALAGGAIAAFGRRRLPTPAPSPSEPARIPAGGPP